MPERGVICRCLPTGAMSRDVLLSPFAWLSLVVDYTASFAAEGAGCLFSERETPIFFHAIWRLPINQRRKPAKKLSRVAKRSAGLEEGGLEQQLATGLCHLGNLSNLPQANAPSLVGRLG